MDNDKQVMAYIGRKPCGCVTCITVDIPDMQKENAKEIAKWIRRGYTVEHVTVEVARKSFTVCPHGKG